MTGLARLGATAFALWGILHIVGATMILMALMRSGASGAYAYYGLEGEDLPDIAGSVLGYFSYMIVLAGAAALGVAVRLNSRNSEIGLAINTALTLLVEIGLIVFLLVPGHVGIVESAPGLLLAALGIVAGGLACRREHAHA